MLTSMMDIELTNIVNFEYFWDGISKLSDLLCQKRYIYVLAFFVFDRKNIVYILFSRFKFQDK